MRPAVTPLVAGLGRLEYRGYDSAGIALASDGTVESYKQVGNLEALRTALDARRNGSRTMLARSHCGIGHTRWATHGRVSEANAHPHADSAGRIYIVLNGIIENHLSIRERLSAHGCGFASETDAEVVAHLIAGNYNGDLASAVSAALPELDGHYAIVVMAADQPDQLAAARQECPLVIGRGTGEQFVASGIAAFLDETRDVQYIPDGEVALVRPGSVQWGGGNGRPRPKVSRIDWDLETVDKAGHETYMLKEVHEQPAAISETLAHVLPESFEQPANQSRRGPGQILEEAEQVAIVACGTSYHAGLIARYAIERWARMPVDVEIASEFRYRDPIIRPRTVVLGISQSGETADTLAALRLARDRGAATLAVTNVEGSEMTRVADASVLTRAGTEIGVAATKTFSAQLALMEGLALTAAVHKSTLTPRFAGAMADELNRTPALMRRMLDSVDRPVERIASSHCQAPFFLYLGRHIGVPVALEAALKLKEISYVAADAYAAGEMKHGPIALLEEGTPVVCVATDSPVLDKMLSNMAEVRARGAHVIAIGTEGNEELRQHADDVIYVPAAHWLLQPMLTIVPLQLLAYRIARHRGLNVDQPRNLAKTVTVE